nr:ATP-binding protein [Azospirillum soli]
MGIAALWWNLFDRVQREERFLETNTLQSTAVMAQLVEEHAIATFRRLDDLLFDIEAHVERDIPLLVPARRSFEEGLTAAIRVYDANGVMTMALGRSTARDPAVERDEFGLHKAKNHKDGVRDSFVIGLPFITPGTRDVFIPVSRRLNGAEGAFLGVAVADVPVDTFARFYGGLNLPPGSSVTLTRTDGPVLARHALQERMIGHTYAASPNWPTVSRSPIGQYRGTSAIDGVERLFSYRTAGSYPVITVVGASTEAIFGPWRRHSRVYVAWTAGTTVVVLLFTTAFIIELRRRRIRDRALRIRDRAMGWSGDGILIADAVRPGMPVVYANPSFERLMGLAPDEAMGRDVLRILEGPMPDPAIFHPLRDAIGAARDVRVEFLRPCRDRGPQAMLGKAGGVWLELRASPVRDEVGRLVSVIAIVRDISAHKNAEAALAEARGEAERANIAKSKFLAAASHDLRQPVQSLMLLMEVLSGRTKDDATRNVLGTMDRALSALKMLLDGLLDVSRLDAGAVQPAVSVFPVSDLLERTAAASRPVAVRKGLILHIVPCRAHVTSDPMLLGRILQNLVENALRYTEKGRILVGCRRRGAHLRIEVWDTGIGIPTDRQEDIFQEFVQVGNASRDRDQGMGLGLAVVRRLAEMLGHPLSLRSEPGRGSIFTVEVPLAEAPAQAEPTVQHDDARRATVLVIEDDVIVREGLRVMLAERGHRVLAAGSCGEALALLGDGTVPDVMVADYRLRDGETGTETIREVRRRLGRALPGILVTGDTAPERLAEGEAGNFRVLHKPVVAQDLHRAIADALDTMERQPALN